MIICICRGKSEKEIARAIDNGATSVRDLQRCGIGDQCGSCHVSLRAMLTQSAAAHAAAPSWTAGAQPGEAIVPA